MKRMETIIICLILAIIFGGSIAFSSNNSDENGDFLKVPLGSIMLYAPDEANTSREPVSFPHSTHFNFSCQTCHHKWKGDADLKTCASTGCHDSVERMKATEKMSSQTDEDIKYFKKAFHQLCIDCHKAIKEKNIQLERSLTPIEGKLPNVGPTSCNGCHPE